MVRNQHRNHSQSGLYDCKSDKQSSLSVECECERKRRGQLGPINTHACGVCMYIIISALSLTVLICRLADSLLFVWLCIQEQCSPFSELSSAYLMLCFRSSYYLELCVLDSDTVHVCQRVLRFVFLKCVYAAVKMRRVFLRNM